MTGSKNILIALAIGAGFGVALGVLNDAMPLWVTVGVVVGLAYGMIMRRRVRQLSQQSGTSDIQAKE